MVNFKDLLSEIRMAVSADYKVTPSGRKVHKMKKIADNPEDLDKDGDVDADDKKLAKEGVVPAHMQGKQKPYVSSDGKGNYEVLGNRGQTKATFHRKEHGKDAHKLAQAHLKDKYDEYMKEEAELEEAVDKKEQRFMLLARMGLVDKTDVSKLKIAMEQLKADKPLSIAQRSLLLSVMTDLVSLVTGDDTVFNRVKMDIQKEETISEGENKQMKGKDPCWKGYQMVGMKDKNGKKVPNCVPTSEEVEEGYVSDAQRKAVWAARNDAKEKKEETIPFEGPYTKVKGDVVDKSGAKHTAMSSAKHLARLALKRQQEKKRKE